MNPFWGGNLGQKWLKLVGGENFADKEKERPPLPEIQFRYLPFSILLFCALHGVLRFFQIHH